MNSWSELETKLADAALGSAARSCPQLDAYFQIYHDWKAKEMSPLMLSWRSQASDDEVLWAIAAIKRNSDITRENLRQDLRAAFPTTDYNESRRRAYDSALEIATRLVFMVDCNAGTVYGSAYRIGDWRPQSWRETQTLSGFIQGLFGGQNILAATPSRDGQRLSPSLDAYTLTKRLHLEIAPTPFLDRHLLLDESDASRPILHIFHHTAFLKAQMKLSEKTVISGGLINTSQSGCLPGQLVAETLMTLLYILFPPQDEQSDQILSDIMDEHSDKIDRDCQQRDEYTQMCDPEKVQLFYWSERLAKLAEAMRHPKPRGEIMTWIEEHSSERNALYVAILGLFLSVLFGLLGVIVGIVQTVISYRAWKYPVTSQN